MRQLLETRQLAINECMTAINRWSEAKASYSNVERYIDPKKVYFLSQEDLLWIESLKEKNYFYLYAGILNDELIFIVTPVDSMGDAKRLDSYLYLTPELLTEDLELNQNINIRKTTTLTSDYVVLNNTYQTIDLSHESDTSISEETALTRIQAWLGQSLDWFYHECNDFGGQRIFNIFRVPFIDLELNPDVERMYCLFGLKKTDIYNMLVPVLNFIAVDAETSQLQLVFNGTDDIGNIGDFSSPCPPFCKDKKIFPGII